MVRFHRRVHIKFEMMVEDQTSEETVTGDLIVPEPELAGDLVTTLLSDWSITKIEITVENSMDEDETD